MAIFRQQILNGPLRVLRTEFHLRPPTNTDFWHNDTFTHPSPPVSGNNFLARSPDEFIAFPLESDVEMAEDEFPKFGMTNKIPMGENSVSVCFPCYNEQDNIRSVYEETSKMLNQMGIDYEIIFVDDGSTDHSPQIAEVIVRADPRVKLIRHATNLGYGVALRSGFQAATKTLVFFTDSDCQFDIKEFPPLLSLMQDYDIVSCFRIDRQEGILRKLNGWCWTVLTCLLFRMKLRDVNCAFKLFKRRVFDEMHLHSTGALINAEILARATRQRFKITQIGVHHFARKNGRQTGSNPKVVFRAFRELISLQSDIRHG